MSERIVCTYCGLSREEIEGAICALEESGYQQAAALMRDHPRCCEPYLPAPPPQWYTRAELERFVEDYTATVPAQYPVGTRFHFGYWSVEVLPSGGSRIVMPYHALVPGGVWEYREHRANL